MAGAALGSEMWAFGSRMFDMFCRYMLSSGGLVGRFCPLVQLASGTHMAAAFSAQIWENENHIGDVFHCQLASAHEISFGMLRLPSLSVRGFLKAITQASVAVWAPLLGVEFWAADSAV